MSYLAFAYKHIPFGKEIKEYVYLMAILGYIISVLTFIEYLASVPIERVYCRWIIFHLVYI